MQVSSDGRGESRIGRAQRLERAEYVAFREALREAMDAAGLSQRELSRRLGMRSSYINKVLAGTRTVDLVEVVELARTLDVDAVELFRRAADAAASPGK